MKIQGLILIILKNILDDEALDINKGTCFRPSNHEWFSEVSLHLSPQNMEQVGRSCRKYHREVCVFNILQKILVLKIKSGQLMSLFFKLQIS
jgi:hypothetical protein